MSFLRPFLISLVLLPTISAGPLKAETAQPSAAENKLRESLRNTMLQLRTSENDKAVAQAALAEAEEKAKALTDQIEKITKQLAADKAAADKATADLQSKVDDRDKLIAEFRDALEKSKVENKRITDIASTKEAQRAKLEEQTIQLNRRVADQQTRNANMFKIANEILARYEKFGLGDALSAREPFTGITRVKLQGLFEEYQDKLVDQKIKPELPATPEPAAPQTSNKSPKAKSGPTKANDQKPKS
jgi:DNA repair exonuclease SbcCD ATPase subunit